MSDAADVLTAARSRAAALAARDADALTALLHPAFRWATRTGQRYDRAAYVKRNTGGTTVWHAQQLVDPEVVVVGDVAVLHAVVDDTVAAGSFRMPVTMTWVRTVDGWVCLAGHAGPAL